MKDTKAMGFYLVLGATLCFAFKGILAKLVYAQGVPVSVLIFYRFVLALPVFYLFYRLLGLKQTPSAQRLNRPMIIYSILGGILFFLSAYCDFIALDLLEVSIERMLVFTYPLFIIIFNLWFGFERINRIIYLVLPIMMVGLTLVLDLSNASFSDLPWQGIVMAMTTAVSYAWYMIVAQKVKAFGSAAQFSLISFVVATVLMVIVYFISGGQVAQLSISLAAWKLSLILILFSTVFPYFFLTEGVQRLGSSMSGLVAMLGPSITLLAAYLILNETLSTIQWVGVVVLYVGILLLKGQTIREQSTRFFERFRRSPDGLRD